jgi:two-component system, chemotaxis family, chemotaxis protein CheY
MKVLVVDDSRAMRMLVRRGLRQAGYVTFDVVEAESGAQALDLVSSESPRLILADWNMPGMSGLELLQTLRAQGVRTPLGFVTSQATPEMWSRAKAAGAAFLVPKPFTSDDFREAMRQVGSVS